MAKESYEVDYNDKRFTKVENAREEALSDLEKTYAGMIDKSDKYYQDQIDASQKWADRQSALQQEKTDFAIQKVEQQKQQAQKDYIKEQSGAYVDWQKQSDQYGAKAEQMASQGMAGTGYSESSQVSMYNTYQNRVMTARDAYQRAILNYDNAITEARLQNNSLLAEIAYNALQKQLELSLQGFQYKNTLILDKTAKKLEVDQMYDNRYQNVLAQINHENAMAEQIRQYNESQALEREKMAEQIRQFNASLAEDQRQFNETMEYNKSKSAGSGGYVGEPRKIINDTNDTQTDNKKPLGELNRGQGTDPIDIESVIKLGYGPLNANALAEKVNSGEVDMYVSNGQTKFRKNAPQNALDLYNSKHSAARSGSGGHGRSGSF